MSDYCNKCAYDMWDDQLPPDINVPKIFRELDEETVLFVLCEGCELSVIGKHEGKLYIGYMSDRQLKESDLREYIIPKNKRVKLCQK